jgi:NAD(P)-dependent dehydrogenase (short-subunit alcohol dehydrogenase family)
MNGERKVILITGCSSGIGRDLARRAAAEGHSVAATARRPESLADLNAALKLQLDVTDPWSIQRAVDAAYEYFGRVDVLMNNAGWAIRGAVEDVPDETARALFDVNLFGAVRMARALLPRMRSQGGAPARIVNIGSIAPLLPFPGHGYYAASKAALEALSDAMRHELAPFGIRVILIRPGPIRTSFSESAESRSGAILAGSASAYRRLYAEIAEVDAALRGGEKGPEAVSAVVLKAIGLRRPKPRYFAGVGWTSRVLFAVRGFAMDAVIRRFHASAR